MRVDLTFDPATGYPAGPAIHYECDRCGNSVPSMPVNADACRCGNITVDGDAGRVSVKDPTSMRAYRIVS